MSIVAFSMRTRSIGRRLRARGAVVALATIAALILQPAVALAHEDQVIRFGSFLGGLFHPVLGLDHFLAMVSVGIVSSMLGGRAIFTVPGLFVLMMAVGGLAGWVGLGLGDTAIESGIAASVILLGGVIAADRRLRTRFVMAAVVFFGFFHGYAHGSEIPEIANGWTYAVGFLIGTAFIHLLGVVVGEVAKRYAQGRVVLRLVGAVFVLTGLLFVVGAL